MRGGSQETKTSKAVRPMTPFAPCAITSTLCRPVCRDPLVPSVNFVVPDPGDLIVDGLNANVIPGGPEARNVTSDRNVEFADVARTTVTVSPLLSSVSSEGPVTTMAGASGGGG